MTKLCLNMIVRNEADKIERCLASVLPYIDHFKILDTGSTDGTVEKIMEFFHKNHIDGGVKEGTFENFEQARNDALAYAREANYRWDYLLLCDADMELVVEDHKFKDQLKGGLGYDVIQRQGGLTYHNRRFVSRNAIGLYRGVTHEFLDVPGEGVINGISFLDHADGTNRKDKYRRDIRLLKKALLKEPNNERYWYYLGQSYRDAGRPADAAAAYRKRVEMGGWDEEVWSAHVNLAHALRDMGNEAGFVNELIEAYNFRPTRAEALYDLAKHYREKGKNLAALMVAEEGMRIPYPTDVLFVQDYVYSCGLKEEFAITAFYDKNRRARGAAVCNELILAKNIDANARELARANIFHYIKPLSQYANSFMTRRIPYFLEGGWTSMNPSVANVDGRIKVILRSVNYTMDEEGRYLIQGTNGEANATNPIHTRNHLLDLTTSFNLSLSEEVLPPEGYPAPAYNLVVGFEDMRLFAWRGALWTISNVREQNPDGWCEQTLARIGPTNRLTDVKPLLPTVRAHEKNWMPWVIGDQLKFVYRLGTTVDPKTMEMKSQSTPFNVDALSGGSQVIPFQGGFLCLVHEARHRPDNGKRYYQHRFVMIANHGTGLMSITPPFYFHEKVIEFAAGLAWHPDGERLMISYGREDKEAWIATVDWHDIAGMFHA